MENQELYRLGYSTILDLTSEYGIFASSRNEAYGCVFGRDTAITVLNLLRVYEKNNDTHLLDICRTALEVLIDLQGKAFNLESGEEPGKCVHEFRPDNYERLLKRTKPWYVYPDKQLRNYDSVDGTALMLIAIHRYWQQTGDRAFLAKHLTAVEAGLHWIMHFGDRDQDGLVEYILPEERRHGGLVVQSWTDSRESLLSNAAVFPKYPIAPVEVQGISWLALRTWSRFYQTYSPALSQELAAFSAVMKQVFNREFLFEDGGDVYAAQALDGDKQQIRTVTGNPLLLLWASDRDGRLESILEDAYVKPMVTRAFRDDLFVPDAGIRTMSSLSPTFNPSNQSYHNGSFWPVLSGMIHEGLEIWNYGQQAAALREAILGPIAQFGCPIELYIRDGAGKLIEYESPTGKKGCRYQAWSAAVVMDLTAEQ